MTDGSDAVPYRTLVHAVADPMYWLAPDGTVRLVNDAMVEFVGVPREKLVGASPDRFLEDEDVAEIEGAVAERLASGRQDRVRHEFELQPPDGDDRWVEAHFAPVFDGGEFLGTVGVVRDITARRAREEALARFETIAETAPVGLTTLDENAVITWANQVFADTLDVEREWLVDRPFPDLIAEGYYDEHITEPYLETVRTLLSSDTDTSRGSYLVETHLEDGGTLLHEVYTALLPMDDGEFAGTVSAFRNVTTQKRYERQLERQNERLDRFASVVSHDLTNPLAVADGYVERAIETEDVEKLDRAQEALERMDSLIDDLLSLAREGRTVEDPSPVAVSGVARAAWSVVDTGGASLTVEDPGRILADPDRLQQLFENFFRNSVEHGATGAADGQGVAVTVGPLEDGFYVADDGPGIPSGDHDRVFDHGYTTAEAGSGLGLSIVSEITHAHEWEVDVTESAEGGCRFEIRGVRSAD